MSGRQLDLSRRTFKGGNDKIVTYDKNGKIEFVPKIYQGLYFDYPRFNKLEGYLSEKTDLKHLHRKFEHINVKQIINASRKNYVRGFLSLKKKRN